MPSARRRRGCQPDARRVGDVEAALAVAREVRRGGRSWDVSACGMEHPSPAAQAPATTLWCPRSTLKALGVTSRVVRPDHRGGDILD